MLFLLMIEIVIVKIKEKRSSSFLRSRRMSHTVTFNFTSSMYRGTICR